MDFASLQVFMAADGGISPAARKLHRVQSNVTTRIQHLEVARRPALRAREAPPASRRRARCSCSTSSRCCGSRARPATRLPAMRRAGCCGSARSNTAASRLPPLLARYHAAHPAVAVELVTGTTDALVEAVLGRRSRRRSSPTANRPRGWRRCPRSASWCSSRRARIPPSGARPTRGTRSSSFRPAAYRRRLQGWPFRRGRRRAGQGARARLVSRSSRASRPAPASASSRARCWRRSGDEGTAVYPLGRGKAASTTALVWRKGELSAPLKALQAEVAAIRTPARRRR